VTRSTDRGSGSKQSLNPGGLPAQNPKDGDSTRVNLSARAMGWSRRAIIVWVLVMT
jgi:hypothetical protein